MAMGRANGNGTSYKGDQTFLLQFQLKIIDETRIDLLYEKRTIREAPPPSSDWFLVK